MTDTTLPPETEPSVPKKTRAEAESPSLVTVIGKIAASMTDDRMSAGELAALRRVDPAAPYTAVLWKVLGREVVQTCSFAPPENAPETRENQWAALLMGMAMCAGLHSLERPLGTALAEAGWSELRFERLMRQEGVDLFTDVRRMAGYLSSKSVAADWTDVAYLLFLQHGSAAEKVRRRLARSYYSALYKIEKSKA